MSFTSPNTIKSGEQRWSLWAHIDQPSGQLQSVEISWARKKIEEKQRMDLCRQQTTPSCNILSQRVWKSQLECIFCLALNTSSRLQSSGWFVANIWCHTMMNKWKVAGKTRYCGLILCNLLLIYHYFCSMINSYTDDFLIAHKKGTSKPFNWKARSVSVKYVTTTALLARLSPTWSLMLSISCTAWSPR